MVWQGPAYVEARTAFMDALADYIDAKVSYAAGDPEWRSSRDVCATGDKLEEALDALFKHD